jgi:4-amino-4-deoxy-L-arabinose transferase-like glycosyltransferase
MVNPILKRFPYLIIALIGIALYFPFLGGIHLFDWDEINFAEAAREMIISGNYFQVQIDYQPFYEKPPLFIWLQVLSFKLFGINDFAARFPNALFGVFSLITVFHFLRIKFELRLAYFWILLYISSILPHLYFKSGIIDPVFNFFIYTSLLAFYVGYDTHKFNRIVLSGVLIGLATLTKGPVAFIIALSTLFIFWLFTRKSHLLYIKYGLIYTIAGLATASIWFILDYIQNGSDFLMEFIKYQVRLFNTEDAGHGGFPGFHVVVLLFGCFPASVFAMDMFRKQKNLNAPLFDFIRFNKILFFVVLILFSVVQSKIVHYSSLCYFPLTFLAAYQLNKSKSKINLSKLSKVLFYTVSFLLIIILATIANIYRFTDLLQLLVKNDPFALDIIDQSHPWRLIDNIPWILLLIATISFFTSFKLNTNRLYTTLIIISLYTILSIHTFPSRIEYYTQKQLIEEIETFSKEGYNIFPLGHKSYAHLYYGKKESPLIAGNIKKENIYFRRIDRNIDASRKQDFIEIKKIPGYVFYKKK